MEGRPATELTSGGRAVGAGRAVLAVLARPRLWPAALRQARVLVPRSWWRRPPFLPLPDRAWLGFRMTTAYGDPAAPVDVEDLLTWLAWTDTVRAGAEGARRARPDRART